MKKKIYFCLSMDQLLTAINIADKYPTLLIVTPSNAVYYFLKKNGYLIKKIHQFNSVIRPRYFLKDILNWVKPNQELNSFKKNIYEVHFSSFYNEPIFLNFLKNCINEPVYVPLYPSKEIRCLRRFKILFKNKQIALQFILSFLINNLFLQVLSIDSEIFIGKLPNQITNKILHIKDSKKLDLAMLKVFNIEFDKLMNPIFLLGYTYDHDVRAFGKNVVDKFLKDLSSSQKNLIKLHPDTNLDQYFNSNYYLQKFKNMEQINPNIPVEFLVPHIEEIRTLGSKVSLTSAEQNKKVFFYTSIKKEKGGYNQNYNLILKEKLSKFENVTFVNI